MKDLYEELELEVIRFKTEDIITTSDATTSDQTPADPTTGGGTNGGGSDYSTFILHLSPDSTTTVEAKPTGESVELEGTSRPVYVTESGDQKYILIEMDGKSELYPMP